MILLFSNIYLCRCSHKSESIFKICLGNMFLKISVRKKQAKKAGIHFSPNILHVGIAADGENWTESWAPKQKLHLVKSHFPVKVIRLRVIEGSLQEAPLISLCSL